jgi:hypothetical protein
VAQFLLNIFCFIVHWHAIAVSFVQYNADIVAMQIPITIGMLFTPCFKIQRSRGKGSVSQVYLRIIWVCVNPLKTKSTLFYIRTQHVPRCKHSAPRL